MKYWFRLDRRFDLRSPGNYSVYAERPVQTEFGKKEGQVSSQRATFQIVAGQQGNAP
jgi:hypothetical protein